MKMEDFVDALKAIAENREVCLPAQIHLRGQINDIIDALGGPTATYEYFKKVNEAELPKYPEVIILEEIVREFVRRGYSDNQILQEVHCNVRTINKIRKEEEQRIKEIEKAEKEVIKRITEPEQ